MNNDNLKGLHGTLIKEGYNPPEYEQFAKDMEDDVNLQGVYETLKKEGYTPPEYDVFKSDMGFGQTEAPAEETETSVPAISPEAAQVAPTSQQPIDPALGDAAKVGAVIGKMAGAPPANTVPGTEQWRANTVNIPGENPYNGRTYGEVYDSIISDYGKNLAHPDIDPYAEARAQIMQSGIADDLKPEDADRLALNIREGYANKYAGNGANQMIASLPDQVPNIDQLMDGLWYTRDMQGKIAHEARRLGLRTENYVNYYVKPHIAKALSDRYGYDVESAKHIAARLLSQEGHTMERVRQNEATAMIGQYAAPKIQEYFDQAVAKADQQYASEAGSDFTPTGLPSGQVLAAASRHYQNTDPAKVWEQMQPEIQQMGESIMNDPTFIAEAQQHADEEGVDLTQWMEGRILPVLESQILSQFEQMAIEREMPKNTMDYLWANIRSSLIGTLANAALASQARRRMQTEAMQRTEMGQGDYKPGFFAKVGGGAAAMLPDMVLPFGGPFGLTAKVATKPVQGMAHTLITDGMKGFIPRLAETSAERALNAAESAIFKTVHRPIVARMGQSALSGSLSLGAFEGVKGGTNEMFNPSDYDDILDGSDRSSWEILKDAVINIFNGEDAKRFIKGAFETGVPSAVTGASMIGGPLGQKLSNGRGVLANILGWGTQVGVDAAGATALGTIPNIIKGDVSLEDVGKEFASNVGTFAALGLHSKAKEFASLADGGRAWNGIPFSKSEVQMLEDRYLSPLRKQISEIESAQKRHGLIEQNSLGIDADEAQREAVASAGAMMYNDLMRSYAVPRELKVKVAQALGVDIPEYALKPDVLQLAKDAEDKAIELGWVDAMSYDYNKPGGVAEKVMNGEPLSDYDLTLRLFFQDNAAYDEALKKQQSGEPLTEQEQELVDVNNNRLIQMRREYEKQERGRIIEEFERLHDMEPGSLSRMLGDVVEGKAVDSNLLNEFEDMLRDYNGRLDEAMAARDTESAGTEETVAETPTEESPAEEAPKVHRVVIAEGESPVGRTDGEGQPSAPPVNVATGTVMEAQTIDGRKAYIVDGDPTASDGLLSLVDEQGNPIRITDNSGYTIDRFPASFIQADEKGAPIINETKPEVPKEEAPAKPVTEEKNEKPETVETTPVMSRIKVDEKGDPLWEESAAEDTAAALRETLGSDEEVTEEVDTEISNLTDELAELTKPDKGKNKKRTSLNDRLKKKEAVRDIQKRLDYWNSVKQILENGRETEAGPQVDSQHTDGSDMADRTAGQGEVRPQGAEGETGGNTPEPRVEGTTADNGVSPVSDNNVAGRTPPVKPVQQPTAEQKIAQGTVKRNIGKRFGFQNPDGTRSEVVINSFKGDDKVEVTRQDYDTNGQPKGDPYKQDLSLTDVGDTIVKGVMKPVLSAEDRLRQAYKGKIGIQNLIDVMSDEEMQKMLDAHEKGDKEALEAIKADLYDTHREDMILKNRDNRNDKVSRIMNGTAGREEKLRRVRKEYQGFEDAVVALSDEAMQPTTLEEYVADLHSRQPKSGEGPIAYFSYDEGGKKVVGLQDETGHGTKSGGDTKGYAPWLAPKGNGMSLKQYAENIHSQLPEAIQEQYSDQDVRNAILEVFGGAERPSDITTMVIRRGIIQAEQAARRMEDMWIEDGPDLHRVSPDDNTFAGRLARAKEQTNTEPSEAQKEKGNYKKGHISFGGYDFVMENPEGSFRRGTDKSGKSWEQKMNNTYGYILGKKGKDGDHLDMFINDAQDLDNWDGKVYVVDQVDPETGKFDEHKIMYGFDSEAEARDAYLSNYEEGWQGLGKITGVDKETFDKWLDSSDRKIKEFAEHSIPKEALGKTEAYEPTQAEIDKALVTELGNELKKSGVPYIDNVKEGQQVINDYNSQVKKMGHKTEVKKQAIANDLDGKDMSSEQSSIASVFTGATNRQRIEINRNDGIDVSLVVRQGTEIKAGSKHAIFRHFDPTVDDHFISDDILLIPDIIKNGERKVEGKRITYTATIDGIEYTVATNKNKGTEDFVTFYTNRKGQDRQSRRTQSEDAQPLSDNALSGAKIQQNPETSKENGEKLSQHKFFKTPDGHAYGFTYKGNIYVDPRIATAETPIHEYGHLWAEMKRQTSPDEWNHIKDVLLHDKLIEPFIEKVRREYPELTGDGKEDDFVEEVLTQFSGKHGAEKLNKMAEEIKAELGNDATAETIAKAAIRKVKSILNEFWKGVADMMGWKYTNAEDIADAVLRDMLNGVNPVEKMKEAPKDLKSQQEIERSLMGVHNISEDKLKKVIKQGGLANPSLAVFDTKNYAHTDYGEISLIPKSSLIDTKKGRNAGTYSGDAWTPTYPSVSKFVNKKGEKRVKQIAKDAANGNEELEQRLSIALYNYVEDNSDRLHFLFLLQKGLNPETRPERITHTHGEYEELKKIFGDDIQYSSDGLTDEQNAALLDLMTRDYNEKTRKQGELIKDEEKREKAVNTLIDNYRQKLVDENGKIWFAKFDQYLYDVKRDEKRRQNPKTDWYATDNDASYRVAKEGLAEEYEKWKDQLFEDGEIDEKLFAGWTPDGQKRYLANTVENASRLMNKEAKTNAYGNGGMNSSKAGLLKKLKTLSDIRKYRHLLKNDDQMKEHQKEMSDEWFDIISQVSDMQKIDSNQFINIDIAEARLQEAMTERDPIGYLNKEYGYDIARDSELASQLMNFIDRAKEMPVKYFETKFERPVGLDEFAIAVVPTTTSPEVIKALEDAGLEIHTYERSSIGDANDQARIKATMEAVQGRDDILFQKENVGERFIDNIDIDTSKTPLPNNRKEAIEAVEKLKRPFINKDQNKEIKVSNTAVKHSATQGRDKVDAQCMGIIDRIIDKAVKIGEIPTDEDETGHTHKVEVYYCPVKIDGTQYSARLVVKQYENRGYILDDFQLYDLHSREKKSDAVSQATGQNALTSLSASDSGYKVKDLIHSTQENDQKLLGISDKNSLKFQKVSNPEPELTPEDRQYWKKWETDMKKWKEQNAIPEDAEEPGEETPKKPDESMMDYVLRISRHRIEKAKWQTAPKLDDYLRQRSDKDMLEAAKEELKRYPESQVAKMRVAAAEFRQIRSAMGRQKAYDKATVKAVTDFAQEYMKLGFGDNLSRGEIERMLSSVKNATGAKDIRKEVDNIMNILTDNYLRNLDQQVQKLSSVKELKQTAQGVEAQGKLELKGQRMIQAFREARQSRMTVDEIRERMAEVSEHMARNDDEAPMWEQEYEGLSIALQYMEDIEGSRSEWGALDREYKDAVSGYRESGRSYAAQQEYLESLDKAMMENKLERIGLFGEIIGRLQGNIAESMEGAKEFVEREKQRIANIQRLANYDLAGKDMGAMREKGKGKPANFFLQPLATFEQMLKQFGARNANGEGYLYDHFMRTWIDSVDKAFTNEQRAKEELDEKAREVFGDDVKRWSDLYKLTRNEKEFPGMDVEIIDQNEPKTFHLNQGNLLYIYMANKMTDGAMKLRKMGITEEDVNAIKEHLDPRLVDLADWLQDDYLVRKRTEYNKVHERMFGAPMAAIDHYFPIRILGDARVQEQDVANMADQDAVLPSTITGNIIKRRRNSLPLDILHTDALSLAIEHVEDMERWAATAEWNKDINTLLSYTTFRNKVKNMKTIYGSGDALWNTFADTARMAAGTYRPKAKPGSVDKTISNIAKGVTAAKISFRAYTAFKQTLSAPAFLHDVDLGKFIKYSVNPYGSWKWAMENMPVFEKRWKSRQVGDTRLMDDPTDWKMWKTDTVKLAAQLGMSPNALVDGITCAVGARSIYESRLKKYKDMGMDEEKAEKRALQDAEIGYNLTQQSSEGAFVSAIQKDRTVAANMLSVFRNSSMAYTRQWVDAARNLKHRMQPGYREDSVNFMARQFEEQLGLDKDKAREAAEKEYARAGRHDVARMLNMMFGVTVAWNLGASLPYLLIGDDDETKKEMMTDALLRGLMAGPTEGFAAGNIISELVARSAASAETRKTFKEEGLGAAVDAGFEQAGDYEVNPLPFFADIQGMIKKMGYDKYAAAQDLFNICMQSAVGVNPQTFTDIWNACMDYGNPSWMPFTDSSVGNDDLANAKEIALFIMRLTNAPTSSWRNKYIDELGMGIDEAKNLSYEEMARRYANYKHWKDAPVMGWFRGDEARQKKMESIRKQFDKAVQERIGMLTDEGLQKTFDNTEDLTERKMIGKEIARRTDSEDKMAASTSKKDKVKTSVDTYAKHRTWQDLLDDLELAKAQRDLKADYNIRREEASRQSMQDEKAFDNDPANKSVKTLMKDIEKAVKDIKKLRDDLASAEDTEGAMQQIRSKRDDILKKIRESQAEK